MLSILLFSFRAPFHALHYKPLSSNCNHFSSKGDYFLLFQIATLCYHRNINFFRWCKIMINNKSIGRKLKELRNSRNLRQSELAELVGLSRPAISNIESGKRSLTLSTLKRFCEVYGIDISYFGIDTSSYDETTDLTLRIESLFHDLPEPEKDELYLKIMKLYLDSKNVSD
nr:MAG TPA: helix-turn-helix domain protein [Caudoviricetes sp.]